MSYLDILWKWRKFIIVNVAIVAVVSVAVSLVLPKWYRGTAAILPPKDQGFLNLFAGGSNVLRGLSALPRIGGFNQNSGAYNYFAILNSHTVMEDVVRRFNLLEVYNVSDTSMEDAIKALRENVAFEFQDDDYITVDVYDKDPVRAAEMANYFVDMLNKMSIQLATREARNNREFIENRLNDARENLRVSEDALAKHQEEQGIIITPEQSSTISAIAELYAIKARKEVEIAVIQHDLTEENEILKQKTRELTELENKLATYPQIGMQSYRLYREVAIGQKIIEVLVPLYEQAKIDEQKDVPVLLVLDKAFPPLRKAKPQRSLIVLSASFLTLFLCVILAFSMQTLIRREPAQNLADKEFKRLVDKIISIYRIKNIL